VHRRCRPGPRCCNDQTPRGTSSHKSSRSSFPKRRGSACCGSLFGEDRAGSGPSIGPCGFRTFHTLTLSFPDRISGRSGARMQTFRQTLRSRQLCFHLPRGEYQIIRGLVPNTGTQEFVNFPGRYHDSRVVVLGAARFEVDGAPPRGQLGGGRRPRATAPAGDPLIFCGKGSTAWKSGRRRCAVETASRFVA